MKGDSLIVVNAINDPKGVHPWVIGPIVEDILLSILLFFVGWKALFVKKNLNSVTHNLASWAVFYNRLGAILISDVHSWVWLSEMD